MNAMYNEINYDKIYDYRLETVYNWIFGYAAPVTNLKLT